MTALSQKQDYQSFFSPPRNTGSSLDASKAAALSAKAIEKLMEAITWQSRFSDAKYSLGEIFKHCSQPGWDGYNATPLSELALSEAFKFIEALPSWVPLPEAVPEPDGSIGFEWYGGKDRVFVVSLSGNNTITYAGLIGKGNREHGVKPFNDSIPAVVIQDVCSILR